jgi:hypothetical protein
MYPFDLERLAFTHKSGIPPKKKKAHPSYKNGRKFLRGPIDWEWLKKAGRLPGKALQVAIILRFWEGIKWREGIKQRKTKILSNMALKDFEISRYAKKYALKNLEDAGLIRIERHRGRSPIVTIIEVE